MYVKKYFPSLTLVMLCLTVLLQAGGSAVAAITSPMSVYSSNKRYFVNDGKPVVLLGAGQPLPGAKSGGYRTTIDNMAAHKVNYGRVWHLLVWDAPNAYFPWARDGGGTAKDGGEKFDLTHWDTNFWSRLRDACAYAQSKNIYLSIHLFDECGIEAPQFTGDHRWDWHPFNPANNVNGLSLPSTDGVPEFYSLSNSKLKSLQELYVAKMISEVGGYPNVIIEICNEYTGPWDWENYWIDFVSARCSNVISVNRLGSVPSNYWSDSDIDMVNYHWGTTSASTTNSNMVSYYSKNRAINYDETPESSSISFTNYRNMLWASFVGGGHIHLESGGNEGAALDAVLHAQNFVQSNGVKFWEMAPNNGLVTSDPGGTAYTLAKPGSEYVVYIAGSGGGKMTISLASGVTYTAKAYNPSNGSYTNLTVSGTTVSGIPSYSSDIVIYIKADGAVTSDPNISLTLTADKSSPVPGDTVTYTVTYRNAGSGTANSVVLSCPVPQYTTYVSGGSYDATSDTASWTIPTISPGSSGMVSFQVKVD